ncbi:MAG: metalloregulator ArsR/SmtB family transcription factor [Desulfobulbaceae bacterium]|nr:metalloregulator ArsR/SmtB family transcription factor [Desulfobulbaceae bacterium]
MRQTTNLFKALTEETRLRILALLEKGELCVCDLIAALQIPQSTVSRHLALLRNAGWVTDRRQGLWMYYRLADEEIPLRMALQNSILPHLSELEIIKKDLKRLGLYLEKKSESDCG